MGLQIKCLLEFNCVCVLFLLTQHVRSSLLGPGGGRYQIRLPSRAATMDLMLTVMGVEPKERESPVELLFMMDATWPQGAAAVRWNRITSFLPKFLHYTWTASFGRPAIIYLDQLCADIECNVEDLQGEIDDRDEWRWIQRERERESDISVLSAWFDDDDLCWDSKTTMQGFN